MQPYVYNIMCTLYIVSVLGSKCILKTHVHPSHFAINGKRISMPDTYSNDIDSLRKKYIDG